MPDADRATERRHVSRAGDGDRPFVTRQIAGETIIVPVCQSVADLGAIYSLNEVGSRIWQLIEGATPVDRITASIGEEYDVPAEQAAADVAAFLGDLEAIGLVRFTGTPGGS